jgi:transposase
MQETSMGRKQHYAVTLSDEERTGLLHCINTGATGARHLTRAPMLLLAAEGQRARAIAQALHAALQTVRNLRKKYAVGGLETALQDRPRPGGARKLTPKGAATLLALACSALPEERPSWTLQRLADKVIALHVVETLADETVRRTLKNTGFNPGSKSKGALVREPPISSGA